MKHKENNEGKLSWYQSLCHFHTTSKEKEESSSDSTDVEEEIHVKRKAVKIKNDTYYVASSNGSGLIIT